MWIAKTKRKIALSLFGAELELTKWELKMKPRWREVVKTWWLIVLTFFLCWSLRFIWIFKTFVFFLDFDKFRTRRLNDRKMFAFYVQVKWQEISYLFVFVSLHILFCLFFLLVGMIYRGINRTKSPKLIQRTGLTQILNREKVKLIQKKWKFPRPSEQWNKSLFLKEETKQSLLLVFLQQPHTLWLIDKRTKDLYV